MWQAFSKDGIKHSSGLVLQQSFYYDAHRRKWLYYYNQALGFMVTFETGIGQKVLKPAIRRQCVFGLVYGYEQLIGEVDSSLTEECIVSKLYRHFDDNVWSKNGTDDVLWGWDHKTKKVVLFTTDQVGMSTEDILNASLELKKVWRTKLMNFASEVGISEGCCVRVDNYFVIPAIY